MPEREGLSRRELFRKGAVVGGHLLWIAPAIQTLTPKVLAQQVSGTFTCCQCARTVGINTQTRALLDTASSSVECQAACQAETPTGNWIMQGFKTSSSPFSIVGNPNNQTCGNG